MGAETGEEKTSMDAESDSVATTASSRKLGAGVAGGVVGFVLGGPIIATIAGFASAWATEKDGVGGDVARAMGDVALTVREKAIEVDEKHHIVEESKKAATGVVDKAKQVDEKYEVVAKTKEFVSWSLETIKDFNRRHRVVERAISAVGDALSWILVQVGGGDTERTPEISVTTNNDGDANTGDASIPTDTTATTTTAESDPNKHDNAIEAKTY